LFLCQFISPSSEVKGYFYQQKPPPLTIVLLAFFEKKLNGVNYGYFGYIGSTPNGSEMTLDLN